MNILFVDQFTDPGGAQRCLMDLLPAVLNRGWTPHLIVPGDGELARWCRASGVPVHPLPLRPCSNGTKTPGDLLRYGIDLPRMAFSIRRLLVSHDIGLVYVNGPRVLPPVAGLTRVPVIFHAHSVLGAGYPAKLARFALRRSNAAVIAASHFAARPYPNARVIYNGIEDLSRGPRSFGNRPVRIGILGRIAPEKGHLDFVRAARLVGGDARFYVFGAPLFSAPEYDRAVRAAAEGAPVEFCGWVNDVASALAGIDLLAAPSGPDEAATRVVMEAFSAGTPVVAYRSGGIPELVDDGRTGMLTASPDAESLARAIRLLVATPRTMECFSMAGRREWESRFRLEIFRNNMCEFIGRVAGPASSASRLAAPAAEPGCGELRDPG